MSVSAENSAVRRLCLSMVLIWGLPVWAQQTVDSSQTVSPGPAADDRELSPTRTLPGAGVGSPSLFGSPASSFDILPTGPQPIILNNNSSQWQRFLDNRKNWALLTPKEILNVPTAESILNIPDSPDQDGLTIEQRFMQREDRDSQAGATNALRRLNPGLDHSDNLINGFLGDRDDDHSLGDIVNSEKPGVPDALGGLKPSNHRDSPTLGQRNQLDVTWNSPFGASLPATKQTPEQLAGMERFRALMEPAASVVKPDITPASSLLASPSASAQDSALRSASAIKSVGRAYTSLEDTTAKPTGLQSASGTGAQSQAPKKVSWVQPPPWMSDSPQNPSFPQRQF